MQWLAIIRFVLLAVVLVGPVAVAQSQDKKDEENYESGALHFKYSYRNGKLDGATKEYYETGESKAELVYQDGKLIAKREFLRNGNLIYDMEYDEGRTIETQIEYYRTGELFRQRRLVNEKRDGLEIEYYRNGQKKAERNYKNGKKEGSAKGYHINGKLQGDWIFKNGEPVSATIYYSTGEKWLVHKEFDKNGRLNGVSREYSKDGNLIAKRYYENDELIQRERVKSWWKLW